MLKLVSDEPAKAEVRPEVSARILWCPAMYVADHFGQEVLENILRELEVPLDAIEDGTQWVSTKQASGFLERLYERVGHSEEVFRQACIHRMSESFGPLRYVLPAATPRTMMVMAAKTMRLVSSVAKVEVLTDERNCVRTRYTSTSDDETRLLCISRTATAAAIPTWFGLPAATVKEHSCIARGDDSCTVEFRFYIRSRWLPVVLGAVVGIVAAALVARTALAGPILWAVLPLLFGFLGALYELRRTYQVNLAHGEQMQAAMRESLEKEAEARREILALHQRQKSWASLLEEQVAERTASLQTVVEGVRALSKERALSVRGFSHDLRNPLFVLRANQILFASIAAGDPELREALEDGDQALERMERMLTELVESVNLDGAPLRFTPAVLEVPPLVEKLRKRTRALVFGRDIRVSVFHTREVPERIVTDLLVFERVVDNLLTNAAKYTEHGSIVVELDGSPGFLTLKVSDTGCGIPPHRIAQVFKPYGSETANSHSLGVGLSVVVQLMAQIGGRLEVMSKPGRGTTFWAHFPERFTPASHPRKQDDASGGDLSNIVVIRRSAGE